MTEYITKQQKHLIWQDELHEPFLLLKYAEVYKHSETLLGLHCWNKKMLAVLRSRGIILFEMTTDDPLYILRVDKCHLSFLISLGAFKKRPDIEGKWVKAKERLLAHEINNYRPKLESEE